MMELSRDELRILTEQSVDPTGWGPVTRPFDNAELNDSELRQRIISRNRNEQPTYLLRLEYDRRLRQRGQ
jgi:hypothetical protein